MSEIMSIADAKWANSTETMFLENRNEKISYEEWLKREKSRIEKDKRRRAEVVYGYGKLALFVNCAIDHCNITRHEHSLRDFQSVRTKV